ncbi:hypothetical protein FA13DRAFT_1727988 [Coprinellus micaceus]|uniref:Brain protein I3 n=1 Tax=Coprinellus micaceus TaxID=71717 RepID=A0A4Y7TQG7_COPMI|nr:hypothetical protein FA13DRAFT_1727988 [Coprinellus micaceus]
MSAQPAQPAPTAQPVDAENVSPLIEAQPPTYPPMYPTGDQYRSELRIKCLVSGEGHNTKTSPSSLGICLAICCFPCGLIALFTMKDSRCTRCGEKV